MSDPVTNMEIEDVLSSIRRLVSNGKQAESGVAKSAEPSKIEPANRLVLTPALRVDDVPSGQGPGIAPPDEIEAPEEAAEFIMPEPEQGRDDGDAEDRAQDETEGHDDASPRDNDEMSEPDSLAMQEPGDSQDEDHPASHAEHQNDSDSDENAEVKGDLWLEKAEVRTEAVTDQVTQDESSRDDDAAPPPAPTQATEQPATEDSPSDLEAQAAEFEAVVASRNDQWEPDGESGDDYAGGRVTPLSWGDAQDRAEEIEEEELSADPDWEDADEVASARHEQSWSEDVLPVPPVEEWGDNDGLSLDDAVLDEEALRDMVSEIVRQELQGALGERITRNVRKLVRREIHRALTSQDMD
ncbi:MAG: hypothetical protein RQ750_15005 [Roseovarius sp.]|nr:hypothetical protein [Roseovarius sp.]